METETQRQGKSFKTGLPPCSKCSLVIEWGWKELHIKEFLFKVGVIMSRVDGCKAWNN